MQNDISDDKTIINSKSEYRIYIRKGCIVSKEKYLFGPVPSRRLGLSLGVDIVPLKTCTQNCLYCQLGKDAPQTLERKVYAPILDVLAEIRNRIQNNLKADHITISGSGEPTLHLQLGRLIDEIHHITSIPVAVITNGSLLWRQDVRDDCARADVVLPSLDAGDDRVFQILNQPHPEITFAKFVEGLCQFRRQYVGPVWLEVFLCEGVNTDRQSLENIGKIIDQIKPDKVQLNTAVRPTAHSHIHAVSPEKMKSLAIQLGRGVEVIADFPAEKMGQADCDALSILEMLRRRPCSVEDICSVLGTRREIVLKIISHLLNTGQINSENRGPATYYKPAP
jgi:wyosine [tRNA(Phe)-imidazoG37] synthetase (radical SAM superfamily)